MHPVMRQPLVRMLCPRCTQPRSLGPNVPRKLVRFQSLQHLTLDPHATPEMPLLDEVEVRLILGRDETDGGALSSRAPSAADAVCEIGRRARQVVIHHSGQSHDVEAAAGQVGSQQDADLPPLEILEPPGPRILIELPVQFSGLNPGPSEFAGHVLGRVPRRHEDQDAVPLVRTVLLQQSAEGHGAIALLDFYGPQGYGGGRTLEDGGGLGGAIEALLASVGHLLLLSVRPGGHPPEGARQPQRRGVRPAHAAQNAFHAGEDLFRERGGQQHGLHGSAVPLVAPVLGQEVQNSVHLPLECLPEEPVRLVHHQVTDALKHVPDLRPPLVVIAIQLQVHDLLQRQRRVLLPRHVQRRQQSLLHRRLRLILLLPPPQNVHEPPRRRDQDVQSGTRPPPLRERGNLRVDRNATVDRHDRNTAALRDALGQLAENSADLRGELPRRTKDEGRDLALEVATGRDAVPPLPDEDLRQGKGEAGGLSASGGGLGPYGVLFIVGGGGGRSEGKRGGNGEALHRRRLLPTLIPHGAEQVGTQAEGLETAASVPFVF
mmetsp:Transcript_28931/g.59218  ORF Transcript_28931/g.59218 Transcript_28931/m.59218 type:complete len:546 (+) Transcript_28931:126-1763(+)